ncbi:hypothetical protein AAFF_G00144890 [Aldrovandia affinis]|uniref:Uncharacterized protein n=1 Tax=Aldrovandia affinis TaxID=143900 RepID=A0AAD7T1P9_9TELE|nr:hypothetical protein AAFF_G00144890 [Aldrovandia affinis]
MLKDTHNQVDVENGHRTWIRHCVANNSGPKHYSQIGDIHPGAWSLGSPERYSLQVSHNNMAADDVNIVHRAEQRNRPCVQELILQLLHGAVHTKDLVQPGLPDKIGKPVMTKHLQVVRYTATMPHSERIHTAELSAFNSS